jgi:hypothetical protein
MATEIGALVVRIGADADDLLKELKKADAGFGSMGRNIKIAHDAVKAFTGAAAAAGAAISAVVLHASHSADQMNKMAQSAGIATSTFSEYAYAARLGDVDTQAFAVSLSKLNRAIADAGVTADDTNRFFKALGIQVLDNTGHLKSADQVLDQVADAFAGMEDGAGKSAIAVGIFGKAGAQMIPMLNEGAAKIKALREEARELGVSIDSHVGRQAEEFNDNLTRLGQAAQGLGNKLTAALLPALVTYTEQMVDAAKHSKELDESIKSIASAIEGSALVVFQTLAVVGSDVAFTFKMIGGEIGVISAQLAALAHGDVRGAKLIGDEWKRDSAQARKDLDDFQARIMSMRKTVNSEGGAMDMGIGLADVFGPKKKEAPRLIDPKEAERREQEVRDAIHKAREEQDKLELGQIQKQGEKMVALMEENEKAMREVSVRVGAAASFGKDLFQDETGGFDPERDARLAQLRQSLKSAEDLENEAHAAKLAQLAEFSDAELAALGGRQAAEQQMEEEHQNRLIQIRSQGLNTLTAFNKASWGDQAKTIFGEMANITAGVAQHNRTLFEINKVAGIANATINAYEGISRTLSKYPYPINVGLAALHAAAAFAQVSAIASTSFGGGGGGAAPSIAGGTPATPVSPVSDGGGGGGSSGGQTTVVSISGDVFDAKSVRALLEKIAENTRDGGKVVIG